MISDKVKTRVFVVEYALNEGDEHQLGTAICHNVDEENETFTLIDAEGYVIGFQIINCAVWKPKPWLGCYNVEL